MLLINGSGGSSSTDNGAPQESTVSIEAALELLAQRERRLLLIYLRDSTERVATTEELVEHICQREAEQTGEVCDPDNLKSELHHIHLPKLTEEGVLEYDPRSQHLRYDGDKRLERCLEWIKREERRS